MKTVVNNQNPESVWDSLVRSSDTALIDVRTRSEWAFVGTVDLSSIDRPVVLVEWLEFPDMKRNPQFTQQVEQRFSDGIPSNLYFICRSGSRSKDAAEYFSQAMKEKGLDINCVNVDEGFEGDLNPQGHRGTVNGWKAKQLPWHQS
ncbi:MAG: rhodanese-like domain-containing protein [Rhodobacteraceae bacterium]|nr:rhodanese-like domain-containing protein [Paracoccaceae bacterium]